MESKELDEEESQVVKSWNDYTVDERLMALVNEIHALRARCDEQAVMIGAQGTWIKRMADAIDMLVNTAANHKEAFEGINLHCITVNNVLLQNELMQIEQYRREFSRAAHVHDQMTAAVRDGQEPMEKQNEAD